MIYLIFSSIVLFISAVFLHDSTRRYRRAKELLDECEAVLKKAIEERVRREWE